MERGRSDMIRFSVVIPTYNRAQLIGRAIDCVLRQTFPCQELLIVDDGSTDDTQAVVNAVGPPVRFIPQSHGGPSKARNLGVSEASAEWIAFLDSDDVWHPDYLARMAGAIEATCGKAALYFSDVEYAEGAVRSMHWKNCQFVSPEPVALIDNASNIAIMGTHPMLLPFSIFRKDVYLKCGGLWEELWSAEDTHLFIRIGMTESVCAVAGSGGVVTSDEGDPANRLTLAFDSKTLRRWIGMVKMYTDLLEKLPTLTPAHRKELTKRLAFSSWRIGRISWREGKGAVALKEIFTSLRTDPTVVPLALADAFNRLVLHRE
jgi:glycosyltransferase involved in cell wall biosynthesis